MRRKVSFAFATLLIVTMAGFCGCGRDKFEGKWAGYDQVTGIYAGTYTNQHIGDHIAQDYDPIISNNNLSLYPMSEVTPVYHEVVITKNGNEYLVTDIAYAYEGISERTFEHMDKTFLYKNRFSRNPEPKTEFVRYIVPSYTLKREVLANKSVGVAKDNLLNVEKTVRSRKKSYRYDEKKNTLITTYNGEKLKELSLTHDKGHDFDDYKKYMHDGLQQLVDLGNANLQKILDEYEGKPIKIHLYWEKDPAFDESAYRTEREDLK